MEGKWVWRRRRGQKGEGEWWKRGRRSERVGMGIVGQLSERGNMINWREKEAQGLIWSGRRERKFACWHSSSRPVSDANSATPLKGLTTPHSLGGCSVK